MEIWGYDEVAEYCLKDCQLVYDLWKHGQDNSIVKGFSIEKENERTGGGVVMATTLEWIAWFVFVIIISLLFFAAFGVQNTPKIA